MFKTFWMRDEKKQNSLKLHFKKFVSHKTVGERAVIICWNSAWKNTSETQITL